MLNWSRISTPFFTILIYHFLTNFYEIINKIFLKYYLTFIQKLDF